jgi:hypothetical protein
MHAGQLTIATPRPGHMSTASVAGKLGGLIARVFGCWHTEMSRPFSHHGQAYRACLSCGAHRQFNLRNWTMQGDFYFQSATTKHFYGLTSMAAVRRKAA